MPTGRRNRASRAGNGVRHGSDDAAGAGDGACRAGDHTAIRAGPCAFRRHTDVADLTGRVKVPVLAIHETGDARVPFALQQSYRRRTIAAGTAALLVQRAVRWPGHCVVDGEIREQAFDDLVEWMEKRVKPAGDDVLAADLSKIGLRWTPILHPDDPTAKRP